MSTISRFAPSPTGFLHVGNIRAAIINFLYAKKTGGEFILRLDDTDTERTRDEYRQMIITDMDWLGLKYSRVISQSSRLDKYEAAKNALIASGRLYECYESAGELNMQRKSQIAGGARPIYNRASLNLTDEQKAAYKKQGIMPYYRFLLEEKTVSWEDKIKGKITFEGRHFSDPVLVRENNVPTYTFCSVVDDIEFNITDIIRGEDHITNTAIQIQIFEALAGQIPHFSHLALVKASEGKISKRIGGFDIKSLREAGFEPMSIINLLSQIGSSHALNIYENIDQLAANFDLGKFSKSATNYDLEELTTINQKLLQIMPFGYIKSRLGEIEIDEKIAHEIDENFWQNLKSNLSFLSEIQDWWKICRQPFRYNHAENDQEFLAQAAKLLPENTSNENSWKEWLDKIKPTTTRTGKALFMPLRLALTGQEHGPELKNLLPLIPRNEILKRLTD